MFYANTTYLALSPCQPT